MEAARVITPFLQAPLNQRAPVAVVIIKDDDKHSLGQVLRGLLAHKIYRWAVAFFAVAVVAGIGTGIAWYLMAPIDYKKGLAITSLFTAIFGLMTTYYGLYKDSIQLSQKACQQNLARVRWQQVLKWCVGETKKREAFNTRLLDALQSIKNTGKPTGRVLRAIMHNLADNLAIVIGDGDIPDITLDKWYRGIRLRLSSRTLAPEHLEFVLRKVRQVCDDLHLDLTCLELNGCEKITDGALRHLSVFWGLKSVILSGCRLITDKTVEELHKLPHLLIVNLAGCENVTVHATSFLEGKCVTIRPNESSNIESRELSLGSDLRKFQLSLKDLVGEARSRKVKEVIPALHKKHAATLCLRSVIDLSKDEHLVEASLECILQTAQQYCPDLTSIKLRACDKITGEKAFKHLQGVQRLYLRGCHNITDTGLLQLIEPEILSSFVFLDVSECSQLSPDLLIALQNARKAVTNGIDDLIIVYPDGQKRDLQQALAYRIVLKAAGYDHVKNSAMEAISQSVREMSGRVDTDALKDTALELGKEAGGKILAALRSTIGI